ncbi:MAG: AAA family ATPase [Solirubrobacteraceae bacterium]
MTVEFGVLNANACDEPPEEDAHAARQLQDGRSFVLDAPTTVPALWGTGSDVLWSKGESLIVCGPQGVGKSTLVQQLALKRAGITAPELIGFPVAPDPRCVLYIAADRPRQIARSLRRMVTSEHADALAKRLRIWKGPLPFDLVVAPQQLATLAEAVGAGTVVIDSLKDVAWPLSGDDVGLAVNRALGGLIAADVEVVVVHHNRKATAENKKPKALADVYGSVWITSGAGSVLSLWGDAGDPVVELAHLKQPVEDVGPLDLEHDHDLGTTRLRERVDAWSVLQAAGSAGITAPDAAAAIYGKLTRPQTEKVRRKLQRLADDGFAIPSKGALPTDPVVFRAVPSNGGVEARGVPRVATRDLHAAARSPENTVHASYTAPDSSPHPLSVCGERELKRPTRSTDTQTKICNISLTLAGSPPAHSEPMPDFRCRSRRPVFLAIDHTGTWLPSPTGAPPSRDHPLTVAMESSP